MSYITLSGTKGEFSVVLPNEIICNELALMDMSFVSESLDRIIINRDQALWELHNEKDRIVEAYLTPLGNYANNLELTRRILSDSFKHCFTERINDELFRIRYSKRITLHPTDIFTNYFSVVDQVSTPVCNVTSIKPKPTQPHLRYLFVYINVLRHHPVGDYMSQLLRVIQVNNETCMRQEVVYEKPFYFPVSINHIRDIKITIRDQYGQLVHDIETTLTLHAR